MTYKFVIHPVDLQDHDGFLSFLSHYAGQGCQAVQIHRSFTLFRRTDTPPAQYSMAFCPRTDRLADGLQPIPGLHNGILIVPQAGSPAARETWNQTVVADYAAFVPYNLISLLSKIIRFLVLPVVVLSVFLSTPFSSFWLPGSLPSTCSPMASTPSTGPDSGRPFPPAARTPRLRPCGPLFS